MSQSPRVASMLRLIRCALDQRHDRHRVVEQPVELLLDERRAVPRRGGRARSPRRSPSPSSSRRPGRPAHPTSSSACEHAEVGEPTGAATAEHQPVAVAAREPGEAGDVAGRPLADVDDVVDAPTSRERRGAARTSCRARVQHGQHRGDVLDTVEHLEHRIDAISARSAARVRRAHHDHTVGLAQRPARPRRRRRESVCSTTWSLPTSASCMNSARRGTPTLSVAAWEIAVRLSTRSTRSLDRCLVVPNRAISAAMSATNASASQSAVTATVSDSRPVERAPRRADAAGRGCRRVTFSIIAGDVATSSSNISDENAASVVSRTARTVADRGARSSRPSSPTTSPRPSSAIRRSSPSPSSTSTDTPTADDEVGGVGDVALAEQRVAGFEPPPGRRGRPPAGRARGRCSPISSATIVATFVRSTRSRAWSDTLSAISGWLLSKVSKSDRSISSTSTGPLARSVAVRRPPATTVTSPITWPASTVPTTTSPCGVALDATPCPTR